MQYYTKSDFNWIKFQTSNKKLLYESGMCFIGLSISAVFEIVNLFKMF